MKIFILSAILLMSVSGTSLAINSMEAQIAVDLYKAEPIYTRDDAVRKIRSLLRNKLNVSKSEINRINLQNGPKLLKMGEYKENLAKYKSLILEEVFSRNPNEEKLEMIYDYYKSTQKRKAHLWSKIQDSIWKIIGVKKSRSRRSLEELSTLRW